MSITIDEKQKAFIEEKLGGEENLKSLAASIIEYYSGNYENVTPYVCEDFNVSHPGPVIAIGIKEMCGCELLMDILIDGERVEAYLSPEVAEYIWNVQEELYDDPESIWNKDEIENYAFVAGKIMMIDSEGDAISNIEIIDYDIAYLIVEECIRTIVDYCKNNEDIFTGTEEADDWFLCDINSIYEFNRIRLSQLQDC